MPSHDLTDRVAGPKCLRLSVSAQRPKYLATFKRKARVIKLEGMGGHISFFRTLFVLSAGGSLQLSFLFFSSK